MVSPRAGRDVGVFGGGHGEVSSVAAGMPVLLKPFTPEALARKVREAVALARA
jgi:hypothetical protein